ncbi:hypothetical protein ACFQ0B_38055 [Nonomuraea thailandensis]
MAGTSSGAIVALHLLAAHPGRVERVVAHEPPVVEVLPDAAEHRALLARVDETFRREGLMPAAAVFAQGLKRPDAEDPKRGRPGDAAETSAATELPPEAAARAERTMAGLPYFLGRIVPSFMAYTPTWQGSGPCRTAWCSRRARTRAASCPTAPRPSWPSGSARSSCTSRAGTWG